MKNPKNLRVRVFLPGNKRSTVKVFKAPPGKAFSEAGIESQLELTASQIEKHWPTEEYRLVATGLNCFNFVHAGPRLQEEQPA